MNSISSNIKRLRKKSGMTQDELAEKMHVTRQAISNWETEKNQPDIESLNALASIFGTDINELIYGNKKNEYPKYQKKHIIEVAASFIMIFSIYITRLFLIPYLNDLIRKTFSYVLESMLFSFASKTMMYFGIGFCIVTVISLWFDCSIPKRRFCLLIAIICVIPIVVFASEILYWKFVSKQAHMYFYGYVIMHEWVRPIILQLLPAVSGVLTFLFCNSKENET